MTHLEFLKNNPQSATLEYLAMSRITNEMEVCSDHPTIRYSNGTVIQGIPDVDRVGIFDQCQHGCRARIRCMCPEHSLIQEVSGRTRTEFIDENATEDSDTKEPCKQEHIQIAKLKKFAKMLHKTVLKKLPKPKPPVYETEKKYAEIAKNHEFCNRTGLDVRPEDDCIVEWLATAIMKQNKERHIPAGLDKHFVE